MIYTQLYSLSSGNKKIYIYIKKKGVEILRITFKECAQQLKTDWDAEKNERESGQWKTEEEAKAVSCRSIPLSSPC